MVSFILGAQAVENFDRVLLRWLIDFHLLETTFESGIFFDVFAELVQCSGTDALKLGTAESRLDDVRGIHGSFGRAGTDDGVKFVDKKDHVFHFADLIHHGFDALFELTAIFRAGDHQGEVEGDHAFIAENFRNVSGSNFLGEALGDGGLADACFTD